MPGFQHGSKRGNTAIVAGVCGPGVQKTAGLTFDALVGRHGPMVLCVCRAILRDPNDAEDAFQATFLVPVR
jgi:hypothetical protein